MARIRTIKPELPQSETLAKVSRDARLLFIHLWTVADDAGRCRAAPRLLAGLLFPFDDDAPLLIEGWLAELEGIGSINRYAVNGTSYLEIPKWLEHQKIDRPTASRLPENPRALAQASEEVEKPREPSRGLAAGPRTLDQYLGPDEVVNAPARDYVAEMTQAAGEALDDTSPATHMPSEILAWLKAGCDFDHDILPAIKVHCARRKPRSVRSWAYFTQIVSDARERRVSVLPPANLDPPATRSRPNVNPLAAALDRNTARLEAVGRTLASDGGPPSIDGNFVEIRPASLAVMG